MEETETQETQVTNKETTITNQERKEDGEEPKNCYECSTIGQKYKVAYKCHTCMNWMHPGCVSQLVTDTNTSDTQHLCKYCTHSDNEREIPKIDKGEDSIDELIEEKGYTTAGLAKDCTSIFHYQLACLCLILIPRPNLESSQKTTRGSFD